LCYDANITFRTLVKIIHTVAGDIDDPGKRFNGSFAVSTTSNDYDSKLIIVIN